MARSRAPAASSRASSVSTLLEGSARAAANPGTPASRAAATGRLALRRARSPPTGLPVWVGSPQTPRMSSRAWKARPSRSPSRQKDSTTPSSPSRAVAAGDVVVDEGEGVDALERERRQEREVRVAAEGVADLEAEQRPQPLATAAHRRARDVGDSEGLAAERAHRLGGVAEGEPQPV